ncbi:MAG TPA: alpha/beta hydrolase [Bacillus bacterium]|nr:alpha/beta hydrolase [Bacillus sp. (in: firmicutes)]
MEEEISIELPESVINSLKKFIDNETSTSRNINMKNNTLLASSTSTIPSSINAWTFASKPNKKDTDDDGDHDGIDDKPKIPFKAPIVLIHGILSNTGSGWGAETFVWNGAHWSALTDSKDTRGEFQIDISSDKTFTGKKYTKGTTLDYREIDLQFIRKVKEGELANYLENKGYKRNKQLFAFNWEGNWHISYAGQELEGYLNNLENHFSSKNSGVDFTLYESGKQRAQFNLVGHSAGGLVSRYYIENLMDDTDPKVKKLITVSTPHWGSNAKTNPGPCGTVLSDLDRDDSYLWYNENSSLCKRQGLTYSLNQKDTNYYGVGGIITDSYYSGTPFLEEIKVNNSTITSQEVFNTFRQLFNEKTGKSYPNLENDENGIEDETPGGELGLGYAFGDDWVTGGSALGIPSTKQIKKESSLYPINFNQRFVYFGNRNYTAHTNINHQNKIFSWIYQRILIKE